MGSMTVPQALGVLYQWYLHGVTCTHCGGSVAKAFDSVPLAVFKMAAHGSKSERRSLTGNLACVYLLSVPS